MYRRKNKKYHSANNTLTTEKDLYDLFHMVRYNKSLITFQENLKKFMDIKEISVENILYQGNNLLISSSIFENENIFQYLIENFKDSFKKSLPQCILFIYPNKNPKILNIALNSLGIPDENFKKELYIRVSNHCYRTENIQIFKEWFEKNSNEDEICKIIEELIHNDNIPFLTEVCYDKYWKKQTLKVIPQFINLITSRNQNYFFHKITQDSHQKHNSQDLLITDYNLSLFTQNKDIDCNRPVSNKSLSLPLVLNQTQVKNSLSTLSKEKIGLKENHKPVIITKKRVSIF